MLGTGKENGPGYLFGPCFAAKTHFLPPVNYCSKSALLAQCSGFLACKAVCANIV